MKPHGWRIAVAGVFWLAWVSAVGAQEKPGQAFVRLSEVSVETGEQGVKVSVRTSRPVTVRPRLIDGPPRLVVDLPDGVYAWQKGPLKVDDDLLKEVRGAQFQPRPNPVARLVLVLSRRAPHQVESTPEGFVVTLERPERSGERPAQRETQTAQAPPAAPAQPAQTQAPPPPGAPTPSAPARSRLITLDFKDADINNILRILAAEGGVNVVAGEDVKGKVTIALRNVPWDLALDTILEAHGLRKVARDNVIRVVTIERQTKEEEAKAKAEEAKIKSEAESRAKLAEAQNKELEAQAKQMILKAAEEEARLRGPLKEELIRLAYADAEEVAKTLEGILGLSPGGTAAAAGGGVVPGAAPPAEPPFSALYGPRPAAPPVPIPSSEVLAKGITVRAHKPTNSLFIRHHTADIERLKKLIKEQLDVPLPQVNIDARIESVRRDALQQLGVQWGGIFSPNLDPKHGTATFRGGLPVDTTTGLPTGTSLVNIPTGVLPTTGQAPAAGLSIGFIGSNINVNLALQALEREGKAKSYAIPQITTVENARAVISQGFEVPYKTVSSAGTQIQFKEALLKLEVTPHVIKEDTVTKIKLKIVVEKNEPDFTRAVEGNPSIFKRRAETEVLVKEGDRVVIGGVMIEDSNETVRGVPGLHRIPLLGWLFKARETTGEAQDLLVIITPRVVSQ